MKYLIPSLHLSQFFLLILLGIIGCIGESDPPALNSDSVSKERPTETQPEITGYIINNGQVQVAVLPKTTSNTAGADTTYEIKAPVSTVWPMNAEAGVERVELSVWGIPNKEFSALSQAAAGTYRFEEAVLLGTLFPLKDGSVLGTVSSPAAFQSFLLTTTREESSGFKILENPEQFSTAFGIFDFTQIVKTQTNLANLSFQLKSAFVFQSFPPPSPPPPPVSGSASCTLETALSNSNIGTVTVHLSGSVSDFRFGVTKTTASGGSNSTFSMSANVSVARDCVPTQSATENYRCIADFKSNQICIGVICVTTTIGAGRLGISVQPSGANSTTWCSAST